MTPAAEHIGKYEILERIGRGGMGTVYKARDPVLQRLVALKTLMPELLAEPGMRERFLREARSAARLQHPNIVTVHEFGEVEGHSFIAMELLEGESLADAVEGGRLSDLHGRLGVVADLCDGLAYAHRHGVVHRDVKPSNVMIQPDGAVKILDFGVAWVEGGTIATRTGNLLGTPSYMAPEQFSGGAVDHRVDVWAVGVILYELATGRRPFVGATVPSLIFQVVHAPFPAIGTRSTGFPVPLARVIEQALAKDPAQRFSDLETMARALRQIRDALPARAVESEAGDARRAGGVPFPGPIVSGRDGRTVVAPRLEVATPPTRPPAFVEDGVFGEPRRVQTVVATPDGATLVAGGSDGSIRLWSLATRMKTATLRNRMHLRTGHGTLTTCLACSPDGDLLASGHLDGAVYLWELASGLELDVKLGHDGAVGGVAFTPDGRTLLSAGADATVKFWDLPALRAGDARRELRRQPEAVTCMTLAGGGRVVVTGHTNRTLRAHEIASRRLVATFHGHRTAPSAVAVSPAGDLVASAGRDGSVRVHDLASRAQLAFHDEHGRAVTGVLFLPGGRRVASVAMDSTVIVWDVDEPELPLSIRGAEGEAFAALALTRDGRRLIGATSEGRFRVWLIPSQA